MKEQQQEAPRQPWEQLPGEPDLWYGRFQVYLELGVTRTLKAAMRAAGEQARGRPFASSDGWCNMPRGWHWRERAHAWDVRQRELLALSEHNTRIALRSRRLARMEDYLDAVCEVLDNANLTEADEQLAREWLPQMRVFLRDLLVAERQEFERGDFTRDDPHRDPLITADDLAAAQRELEAQGAAGTPAPGTPVTEMPAPGVPGTPVTGTPVTGTPVTGTPVTGTPGNAAPAPVRPIPPPAPAAPAAAAAAAAPAAGGSARTLFVCVGPDQALMIDLAALRAVRAATGLQFKRLLDATRPKFADMLRRERGLGRPIELLHLALHASPAGVAFADGIADGNWLSERLFGVRIMLLAGCECDAVGDWLGVVPHVITLGEAISHEDAAVLTQHFWHNIGLGLDPGPALDEALTHCPPAVSEYVVRHW